MNDITPKSPFDLLSSMAEQFPGAEDVTYLDTAARSLLPLAAKMAVEQHLQDRLLGRADKASMFAAVEEARGRFADLINAEADEIAITKNVSEGLNIIATAFPWEAGDNVVLCLDLEHPNNVYPWLNLRDRAGKPSCWKGRKSNAKPSNSGACGTSKQLLKLNPRMSQSLRY